MSGSHSDPAQHDSYDPRYFEPLFAIEDRHFWFRSRNLIISTLASQLVQGFPPGYRALEVGCGTGNTLRVLERACEDGTVIGVDLFLEGLQYARQRVTCPLVQGDMHALPFAVKFDLIGLFDVLEHLPDDVGVLRALHETLAPGGKLFLTVPAHMSLWSYFDVASHHVRRYEQADLTRKLEQAGYRIEFSTPYMACIVPLVWLGRRAAAGLSRGRSQPDRTRELANRELKITPGVNALLTAVLSLEMRWLARRRTLPVGTSLVIIASQA